MRNIIKKINILSMPFDFNLPHSSKFGDKNKRLNFINFWEKANPVFKSKVLAVRDGDLNIETTGYILEETGDLLFFCSILGKNDESYRNIKIISKKSIKSTKLLNYDNRVPIVGDVVLVNFEDTLTNFNIGNKKEILEKVKHGKVDIVGYLMSDLEDDVVMVSLIKNIDLAEYKFVMSIPKNIVKSISVLS